MGYALAQTAIARGADVVLISGPTQIAPPRGAQLESVKTTDEMYHAVLRHARSCDIIVAAAAPCDFRPLQLSSQKIKKQGDSAVALHLVPTPDIIGAVGAQKGPNQIIIAFAAETENVIEEARRKMATKHADAIVANDVTESGAGFDVPTNRVTWITPQVEESWPLMKKEEVSAKIWDKVAQFK
jgi:phosphopantothenoylcysteine decarboxylase/phosphopantothenate--cysteine ligase